MSSNTRIFTVDKFLGLNESADGSTELKLGEASKLENFYITDNFNLKSRDGAAVVRRITAGRIVSLTSGTMHGKPWFLTVSVSGTTLTAAVSYTDINGSPAEKAVTAANVSSGHPVKVFPLGDRIYIVARQADAPIPVILSFTPDGGEQDMFSSGDAYIPTVITGAPPAGGGDTLETVNLLNLACRMQFSADGAATAYTLPSYVASVTAAYVDNAVAAGSFDASSHVFTFETAPVKGVNNVEFRCTCTEDAVPISAREKFFNMKHCEAYNGDTDTRLFFYGDGTNICYYTGITDPPSLYVPLGNELAADASASPITAMVRNYSSLIGFQADGAFVVTYEPITLSDGSVIAGFYLRTASREFGNEMDGQVQTVNNYLRTLSAGSLYEWRYTASQYRDERYAKRISEKVSHTLSAADPRKIVTCDDNVSHTYYMFLNDDAGTVLVNRYNLELWTVYKGEAFRNICHAAACGGEVMFANPTTVFRFDSASSYDAPVAVGGDAVPITSVWESGFMAFGADYKRKYSSRLWVSLLPQSDSDLEITVRTDKRSDYITKNIGYFLSDFSRMNFSSFSFDTWRALKIKRVQIKVKKFVYYKLILRVTRPGARATVLGYDQQVRYSSDVK